jgi:hypothetical protein
MWVNLGEPWNGHGWYIPNFTSIFFGHLECITAIRYILRPLGNLVVIHIFSPILVNCAQKNLATLQPARPKYFNNALVPHQGDQIGRIFPYWAIFFLGGGQFL